MKYRVKETGEIKSQGELRRLNPNKILPKVWGTAVYDDLQVDPILSSPKPNITELQTAYVSGAEQDTLGNWVESWVIQDKFKDQLDTEGNVVKTAADQIAEYEASKIETLKKSLVAGVDSHIQDVVKSKGYDNTDSIAKYLVEGNPFNEECTTLSIWIGNVWVAVNTIQSDVVAGNRTIPTFEELVLELPKLVL